MAISVLSDHLPLPLAILCVVLSPFAVGTLYVLSYGPVAVASYLWGNPHPDTVDRLYRPLERLPIKNWFRRLLKSYCWRWVDWCAPKGGYKHMQRYFAIFGWLSKSKWD